MTRLEALRCQGARCGYIDGKARAGLYVVGEEAPLSVEAAMAQNLASGIEQSNWAKGYRIGYCVGAGGGPLPGSTANAPLPEDCK